MVDIVELSPGAINRMRGIYLEFLAQIMIVSLQGRRGKGGRGLRLARNGVAHFPPCNEKVVARFVQKGNFNTVIGSCRCYHSEGFSTFENASC